MNCFDYEPKFNMKKENFFFGGGGGDAGEVGVGEGD